MNGFELLAEPRRVGLRSDGSSEIEVLVRLQAPDASDDKNDGRSHGFNLAFVIDRSGSMNGQPLREAVRCVGAMTDRLRPDDRAALVIYDDKVDVLLPSLRVGDGRALHRNLATIDSRGTTNLHGGWLKGAELLADTLAENQLARVILLSDGLANRGITDDGVIANQCAELAAAGVSTSTYGLGGNFNEDLMVAMGHAGRGNHYYGETADDLMEPFVEEFSLLDNLCARDVTLSARTPNGVTARMVNDLIQRTHDTWLLPDVAYGGEAWAVFRLTVGEDALSQVDTTGNLTVLELTASFADMNGARHETPKVFVTLPLMPADAYEALAENELVRQRVLELRSADFQRRAAEAARVENWGEVDRLLLQAESEAGDNPWVAEVLVVLRRIAALRESRTFRKRARYSEAQFERRIADKKERLFGSAGEFEDQKAVYLRRKREQGKREWRESE